MRKEEEVSFLAVMEETSHKIAPLFIFLDLHSFTCANCLTNDESSHGHQNEIRCFLVFDHRLRVAHVLLAARAAQAVMTPELTEYFLDFTERLPRCYSTKQFSTRQQTRYLQGMRRVYMSRQAVHIVSHGSRIPCSKDSIFLPPQLCLVERRLSTGIASRRRISKADIRHHV